MSGLLERIARRRRASASSRLGPPPDSADRYVDGMPQNGSGAQPERSLNGAVHEHAPAPVVDEEPEPEAAVAEDVHAALDAASSAEPEAEQATTELWVADEDEWIEPEREASAELRVESEAEPEPEPEAESEPKAEPEGGELAELTRFERQRAARRPARAQTRPDEDPEPPPLGLVERARIRRRARYLRRLKEVQLRDIGGFVLELHRFGRDRPDLVSSKIASAADTDRELRALEQALYGHASLRELREAGIGGACSECGAVHGSDDHFCASCGADLRAHADDEPGELDDTHA